MAGCHMLYLSVYVGQGMNHKDFITGIYFLPILNVVPKFRFINFGFRFNIRFLYSCNAIKSLHCEKVLESGFLW